MICDEEENCSDCAAGNEHRAEEDDVCARLVMCGDEVLAEMGAKVREEFNGDTWGRCCNLDDESIRKVLGDGGSDELDLTIMVLVEAEATVFAI